MPRSVNSVASRQRRKKILKQAKGYFGRRKNVWTIAKNAVEKAMSYAYRDRKNNKRNFRSLWITRINAGARLNGMSYSQFMGKIKSHNIDLNRKVLADLAMKEKGFVEFLPGTDAIIIDEAHQLPDLAVQFFGVSLSSRELERLVDETRAATLSLSQPELNRRIDNLQTAISNLRADAPRSEGRHELNELMIELREPARHPFTCS